MMRLENHLTGRLSLRRTVLAVDGLLIRLFGLGYMRLVRNPVIHEHCAYLVAHIRHRTEQDRITILDAGCGSGMALLYVDTFCRNRIVEYTGVDSNIARLEDRYRFVTTPHRFLRVDLDEDVDLGQFDLVFCSEVIEHFIDDSRLFRTLCAHVKKDGHLVVTTPSKDFVASMAKHIHGFDTISATQDGGHVRTGYTASELEELAETNRMKVLSVDWISWFDAETLRRLLGRRNLLSEAVHNLTNPRSAPETKFVFGGDPEKRKNQYWSIGISLLNGDTMAST